MELTLALSGLAPCESAKPARSSSLTQGNISGTEVSSVSSHHLAWRRCESKLPGTLVRDIVLGLPRWLASEGNYFSARRERKGSQNFLLSRS